MAIDNNNSCATIAQSQKSNLDLINHLVQYVNLIQELAINVKLESKNVLQQLQQIDIQTEATAKAAFLDNMRHRFITPLAGILNLAEVLEKQEKNRKRQEQLHYIWLAGTELSNIFKQLLEFENINSGKYPVVITDVNIRAIIAKIKDLMAAAIYANNLKLIVEIDEEIPKSIKTDKFRLQMILINLVSNAICFTEEGYIKLSVAMPVEFAT
jgi:signal transduction histidine kinase